MNAYDELPSSADLPMLSAVARELLALGVRERENAKLLGLFAQRDPVLLARLLSAATSAGVRRVRRAANAHEAIAMLGTDRSYALMLAAAQADSFGAQSVAARLGRYLLHQAVSVSLTAQRLARLVQHEDVDADVVFLAALLDVLGVHVLLVAAHPKQADVHRLLAQCADANAALPLTHADVLGYRAVSVRLARKWDSDAAVVSVLQWREGSPDDGTVPSAAGNARAARLLALAHELVAAKLGNVVPSEQAVAWLGQSGIGASAQDGAQAARRALELVLVV